jgi:integrase
MLVKEHVEKVLSERPYKYQTKVSYMKAMKTLGILDMKVSSITPPLCIQLLDGFTNQNVKKNLSIAIRAIFNFTAKEIPFIDGIPKTYDLPTKEELHRVIDRSKYKRILYLCMYAGLRIGEACAVVPEQVKKQDGRYWLHVDRAFSQDGKHLGSPKTMGRVMIPDWMAEDILSMKKEDYWKKGQPTLLVTWSCVSLSKKGEKIHINPHMLRHWFATDMVNRGVPIRVISDQLRHKNINTTLRIYAQVNTGQYADAVPTRPNERVEATGKVIPFKRVK